MFGKIIIFLIFFLMFTGCSSSDTKPSLIVFENSKSTEAVYKIAVLPFKYKYVKQNSAVGDVEVPLNASEIVPKYIEKMLIKSHKYRIVERENLAKIMEEQKISLSGLTNDPAQAGMLFGADGIITGEIIEVSTLKQVVNLKGTCIFSMKLIDIKSGEVRFTFNAEESVSFGTYLDALNRASEKFYNEICKMKDLN